MLVVDDNTMSRLFLKRILSQLRVTVLEAADGEEALARATEQRPDLILCDIDMPGTNGIEFVRSLRASPDLEDTPLVMVTASGNREDVLALKELGVLDYLVKPVPVDVARARLERILLQVADRGRNR